jgi:penicillin-binding protein 1A
MRTYVTAQRPPAVDFPRPAGIVAARIDPLSGLLARPDQTNALEEVFLAGTEPREIAVPVGDAGAPNFFTSFLTGGDGGIPVEVRETPPPPPPTSEAPLVLPEPPPSARTEAPPPAVIYVPPPAPEPEPESAPSAAEEPAD